MRIIAGQWRGRPLNAPKDRAIRPTTDRIREALFSKLESMSAIQGANALDCFAGTGALGLEALSRGAASLTLVENAPSSLKLIQQNLKALDADATIMRQDATKLGQCPATSPYSLVFLDPPYGKSLVVPTITKLIDGNWVEETSLFVIESDKREILDIPQPCDIIDERTYGDTRLSFVRIMVT